VLCGLAAVWLAFGGIAVHVESPTTIPAVHHLRGRGQAGRTDIQVSPNAGTGENDRSRRQRATDGSTWGAPGRSIRQRAATTAHPAGKNGVWSLVSSRAGPGSDTGLRQSRQFPEAAVGPSA